MTTERCSGGAHGEGWPLWLEDVEGLDVGARRPHKLVVVVEVLLGEGRLPLPGALNLHYLHSTDANLQLNQPTLAIRPGSLMWRPLLSLLSQHTAPTSMC